MKKPILFFLLIATTVIILSNSQARNEADCADCSFSAVEMPAQLANGHAFPTDSSVVKSWIAASYALNGLETNADIISHAWGLWAALIEPTDQTCDGRKLLRYETWYTPQDVMRATANGLSDMPKTLSDIGEHQARTKFEAFEETVHGANLDPVNGDIVGKVKYNPAMAEAALDNRYFDPKVMAAKIDPRQINAIVLPNSSVMLKPVYRVLSDRMKVYDGMYQFHVWSGKSDAGKQDSQFERYVYVCTDDKDPRIDGKDIFGISNFISHRMSAAEAATYNTATKEGNEYNDNIAKAGDQVILIGMHVASRENPRWTWQTFYWSPTPNAPLFPSSNLMAAGRTTVKGLSTAARNYNVSLGYNMVSPAAPPMLQPDSKLVTANRGSVYALNPYIEGTFTPDVFGEQENRYRLYGLQRIYKPNNIEGISSNCMSCHHQAVYSSSVQGAVDMFVADQYVARNAPWFIGKLQTDFAWSLSGVFEKPYQDFADEVSAKKDK